MSILSLVFFGLLMISEEILLKNFKIESTLLAGFEGAIALGVSILFIPVTLTFFEFLKYKHYLKILNAISPGLVDFGLFFD